MTSDCLEQPLRKKLPGHGFSSAGPVQHASADRLAAAAKASKPMSPGPLKAPLLELPAAMQALSVGAGKLGAAKREAVVARPGMRRAAQLRVGEVVAQSRSFPAAKRAGRAAGQAWPSPFRRPTSANLLHPYQSKLAGCC